MTFYESPQVDENSKRSEESVLQAKGFFSQKMVFFQELNPQTTVLISILN